MRKVEDTPIEMELGDTVPDIQRWIEERKQRVEKRPAHILRGNPDARNDTCKTLFNRLR